MRLIYENASQAVSEARVADYRKKRIAIDANIYVYKSMAQRPFYNGRHIVRMLRLARWLRRRQIEPLFVFDNQQTTLRAKERERNARRARKRRNAAVHRDVLLAIETLKRVRDRCTHVSRIAQFCTVDVNKAVRDANDALLFALEDAEEVFLPRKLVAHCLRTICARVSTSHRLQNRSRASLSIILRCATLLSRERDWVEIDLARAASTAHRARILETFRAICETQLNKVSRRSACATCSEISHWHANDIHKDPQHFRSAQQNIFVENTQNAPLSPDFASLPSPITFCVLRASSTADIPADLVDSVERCWQNLLYRLQACEPDDRLLDSHHNQDDNNVQPLPAILPVVYCAAVSLPNSTTGSDPELENHYRRNEMTCLAPQNTAIVTQLDSAIKIHCARRAQCDCTALGTSQILPSFETAASSGQSHKKDKNQTERSLERIVETLTRNMPSVTKSQSTSESNETGGAAAGGSSSSSGDTSGPGSETAEQKSHKRHLRKARLVRILSCRHCAGSDEADAEQPMQLLLHRESEREHTDMERRLVRHGKRGSQPSDLCTHTTADRKSEEKMYSERLENALEFQGGDWCADTALLAAITENKTSTAALQEAMCTVPALRTPLLHLARQCRRKRTISALNFSDYHHDDSLERTLHRLVWRAVSLEAQTVRVHYDQVDQVKRALTLSGECVIEAPNEAEQHCSRLCASGQVYAVMSDDTDIVPFGARRVLRKCRFAQNASDSSVFAQAIDCEKLQHLWRMSRAQLVDLCILIGCDFCKALRDISARHVFRCFVQQGCSLEKTLEALPPHCAAPLRNVEATAAVKRAREIFLGPPPPSASDQECADERQRKHRASANADELRRFLTQQQCLHRAREYIVQPEVSRKSQNTLSASFDETFG